MTLSWRKRMAGKMACAVAMAAVAGCSDMGSSGQGESGTVHTASAQPDVVMVQVDQPGIKMAPMLYGLMTEEINHAYDGGLYAELIQNRIFKDPRQGSEIPAWSVVKVGGGNATLALDDDKPVNRTALTTSLRLDLKGGGGRVGVANGGYWGIPVRPNTTYRASFYARATADFRAPLTIGIESNDGKTMFAQAMVTDVGPEWKKYDVMLKTTQAVPSTTNRFVIWAPGGNGSVWFNLVSLFPPTMNDRPNGMRKDLMELMGGMKPTFLRFPGGNYLEGNLIEERFDWKKTIGDLENRPGHQCPWGYRSTDGMGLLEFLEWCEDLKMEPILAVYAGYSLSQKRVTPGTELEPFVQDALDEIEYVTGGPDTKWGAQRIKDGHREPFKLQYVEVGNEDFFDNGKGSYEGRFAQFFDGIKKKYPQLQVIATTPVQSRTPDVVDDHYYRSARDMAGDWGHYDATDKDGKPKFPRTGPKIFVGEWATTQGSPTPTMEAAAGDAVWMMGMEKNSDVVVISCYAPLLVNVNPGARQWGTNLIGYDALHSFGSPSYWAQRLFAENKGDRVLPTATKIVATPIAQVPMPKGAVGVGSWSTQVEYKDLKVVAPDGRVLLQPDLSKGIGDWKKGQGQWEASGGSVRQTGDGTECRVWVGDPSWTDYVMTVKAKKVGGVEGFMVLFHVADADNYLWWNIGGWTNSRTALEKAEDGARKQIGLPVEMKVDSDRWYDVKVEVKGRDIKCYIDGKLTTEATDEPTPPAQPVYASASTDEKTGEVIVKVVNISKEARQVQFALRGVSGVAKQGQMITLSGGATEVNTLESPDRVAPKKVAIDNASTRFTQEVPACSLNILRLKPQ